MARWLDGTKGDFSDEFAAFLAEPRGEVEDVAQTVTDVLADVRAKGGEAVARYTAKFDRLTLDPVTLQSDNVDLHALAAGCPADLREAIDYAAERITAYHERQRPSDNFFKDAEGIELGWRWTPLDSVGVYVPGGLASYPSSVLMNAVPAKLAGVKRVVMTAPAPGGQLSNAVAYAALKAGVDEFYPIGGAQAVAALTFGAGHLKPVDKIVGPGNAYVAAAKRQVYGTVGIDSIAGPSEILVIADSGNDPAWIAADLLSQAEHDEAAQAILITDDAAFADAVDKAVETTLATLERAAVAGQSWQDNGAIVTVASMDDMPALANRIAAEHLELAVREPRSWLGRIRHAGAVFLGRYTPEAIGDYVAGPNHVLPTARTSKFSSGLGVVDFMKRTTTVECDAGSFASIAPAGVELANAEGLGGHALSMTIRMNARS